MAHKRYPDRLAFILNNPVRRFLNPPERLISKLGIGPDDVVLDFGCGPGFYTIAIAAKTGSTIGVDISSKMLDRAAKYAKRNGVTVDLIQSDGTEIKLADGSVDLIFLAHVFHEVENRMKVLKEFFRIMKPFGRLALVERTRGSSILSGRVGPPVINETSVIQEIERAGFMFTRTIPDGKDSIIIGQKAG